LFPEARSNDSTTAHRQQGQIGLAITLLHCQAAQLECAWFAILLLAVLNLLLLAALINSMMRKLGPCVHLTIMLQTFRCQAASRQQQRKQYASQQGYETVCLQLSRCAEAFRDGLWQGSGKASTDTFDSL
jgi:hypothetical protein